MAVLARHFGYKPVTQSYNFPGYTEHGARLIVQDNYIAPFQGDSLVPGQEFSGFEWTMGPDEDRFHSIICYTAEVLGGTEAFNTEGTIGTADYAPGDGVTDVSGYAFDGTARKLAFKGVPTQADFLGIANELGIGTFTTDAEAVAEINNTTLGCWTNYDGVNSNQDGEGGGDKENPTDFYYEVTACGGATNYILKTTTELTRFSAYVATNVIFAEGLAFDSETYVVVRSTTAQAHQLFDQTPVLGTCEA